MLALFGFIYLLISLSPFFAEEGPKPRLRQWASKAPMRYSVEESKKVIFILFFIFYVSFFFLFSYSFSFRFYNYSRLLRQDIRGLTSPSNQPLPSFTHNSSTQNQNQNQNQNHNNQKKKRKKKKSLLHLFLFLRNGRFFFFLFFFLLFSSFVMFLFIFSHPFPPKNSMTQKKLNQN